MKKISLKYLYLCISLSQLVTLAHAEEANKPWNAGVKFSQREQGHQALTITHAINKHSQAGLLIGHQSFKQINESDKNDLKSIVDLAGLIKVESTLSTNLVASTNFLFGLRDLPENGKKDSSDHAYFALEETLGVKEGKFLLFVGAGAHQNFFDPLKQIQLGKEEVKSFFVYPTFGASVDF